MTSSKCRKPICKRHAEQTFICNACTTPLKIYERMSLSFFSTIF
nr:unnamed protein product [Callosobruchus analis]